MIEQKLDPAIFGAPSAEALTQAMLIRVNP